MFRKLSTFELLGLLLYNLHYFTNINVVYHLFIVNQQQQYSRDLARIEEFAEHNDINTDSFEADDEIPNILMRILKSDRDYDGPVRG